MDLLNRPKLFWSLLSTWGFFGLVPCWSTKVTWPKEDRLPWLCSGHMMYHSIWNVCRLWPHLSKPAVSRDGKGMASIPCTWKFACCFSVVRWADRERRTWCHPVWFSFQPLAITHSQAILLPRSLPLPFFFFFLVPKYSKLTLKIS